MQRVTPRAIRSLTGASEPVSRNVQSVEMTTYCAAVSLVHQLSKDVGWIRHLAKRAAKSTDDYQLATRDLKTVLELCDAMSSSARRFLDDAARKSQPLRRMRPLDSLLEAAAHAVTRRNPGRVDRRVDPEALDLLIDDRLEAVLVDLLDNALQSLSREDVPVVLSARASGRNAVVVVRDHGRGMTGPELESCWTLGFTTRARAGGSGIGLAVSRAIVEAMGGSFEIESAPRRGTVVKLVLPYDRPARSSSARDRGSHDSDRL